MNGARRIHNNDSCPIWLPLPVRRGRLEAVAEAGFDAAAVVGGVGDTEER